MQITAISVTASTDFRRKRGKCNHKNPCAWLKDHEFSHSPCSFSCQYDIYASEACFCSQMNNYKRDISQSSETFGSAVVKVKSPARTRVERQETGGDTDLRSPKIPQQRHTVEDLGLTWAYMDVGQVGPRSILKAQLSFRVPHLPHSFILLTTLEVYRGQGLYKPSSHSRSPTQLQTWCPETVWQNQNHGILASTFKSGMLCKHVGGAVASLAWKEEVHLWVLAFRRGAPPAWRHPGGRSRCEDYDSSPSPFTLLLRHPWEKRQWSLKYHLFGCLLKHRARVRGFYESMDKKDPLEEPLMSSSWPTLEFHAAYSPGSGLSLCKSGLVQFHSPKHGPDTRDRSQIRRRYMVRPITLEDTLFISFQDLGLSPMVHRSDCISMSFSALSLYILHACFLQYLPNNLYPEYYPRCWSWKSQPREMDNVANNAHT